MVAGSSPLVVVGWACDQCMIFILNDGLQSKWQQLYCRYIIITADFAGLQPDVVIHVALCFGGTLSGAAVSHGFNIETVTAGSEPCN